MSDETLALFLKLLEKLVENQKLIAQKIYAAEHAYVGIGQYGDYLRALADVKTGNVGAQDKDFESLRSIESIISSLRKIIPRDSS